jgi:hypothetical protein
MTLSRRDLLRGVLASLATLALPDPQRAALRPGEGPDAEDTRRLDRWVRTLRAEGLDRAEVPLGRAVDRAAGLAIGTPYVPYTLEAYLRAGGSPRDREPLTLSLSRFDCVTLVESSLALARAARRPGEPDWAAFAREVERVRYRGGTREGYLSRLHYFSEWLDDNERRGLVRVLGRELGGEPDARPLRFMSTHPDAYPALRDAAVRAGVAAMEKRLDGHPRWVIPTARIAAVQDRIQTGDVLAFATAIDGLDVTHSALAHRGADGVLHVLHAPLSGGEVEITGTTLPEYVARIRRSTGVLVARPR